KSPCPAIFASTAASPIGRTRVTSPPGNIFEKNRWLTPAFPELEATEEAEKTAMEPPFGWRMSASARLGVVTSNFPTEQEAVRKRKSRSELVRLPTEEVSKMRSSAICDSEPCPVKLTTSVPSFMERSSAFATSGLFVYAHSAPYSTR